MTVTTGPAFPVCQHIARTGTAQPFALLAIDHETGSFLCSECAANESEQLIHALSPGEIASLFSFAACGHTTGHCFICETGTTASLQKRWANLKFSDTATANKFRRLLRLLGDRLNRDRLKRMDRAQDDSPAQSVYSPQMLRSDSLMGDRARASLRWEHAKAQRQRTLRSPAQTVRVIPPARSAATA